MGQAFPIELEMPDGTFFKGEAPIRGKTTWPPEFVLMGWLNPPDRSLTEVIQQLLDERDQHEEKCARWIARLERAVRTQRFNDFWIYEPPAATLGLPKDASRAEIAQAYRQWAQEHKSSLLVEFFGLSEDLKGAPGCERIGVLRHFYGWTHDVILKHFELQLEWSRKRMQEPRRNLPQRRDAAGRSSEWFSSNHGRWIAIEAHRKFINPSPTDALNRLPGFNRGFNGTHFYQNHQGAFQWLGTVNIDSPAEADWQITPDKEPLAIPKEPAEILADVPIEGKGRFLFSLLVDDVDLQDPAGQIANALKTAGLKFAIRSCQQIGH